MTSLIRYEAAKAALVEARSVDEVLEVRRASERMKLYARQAKDRGLLADATQIQVRAERKLGAMIISAKETGQLGLGRPSRSNLSAPPSGPGQPGGDPVPTDGLFDGDDQQNNTAEPEAFSRTTLKEAGIDHKLSSKAQAWARLGESEFAAKLTEIRERIESSGAVTVNPKIGGERSLMSSRREPDDSLDFFPTPPWATRSLVEDVLPRLGLSLNGMLVGEPACGEGHIAGVIEEYSPLRVHASDVFDYAVDGRAPPGWIGVKDFADPAQGFGGLDWIISNFPFGERALPFTLRALDTAAVGVALFVRQQWLEGVDRYEQLFSVRPPTLVAQFSERVNLCKGRWEPDGSTATAYCWLVWMAGWLKGPPAFMHTRLMWIPPGRRDAREKIDDRERFTAHPVLKFLPDSVVKSVSLVDGAVKGPEAREAAAPLTAPSTSKDCREAESGGVPLPALPSENPERSGLTSSDPLRSVAAIREDAGTTAPGAALSLAERDAVIRDVYARDVAVDFAEIERRTGLDKVKARKRAYQLGVSSRERQRTAASAYTKGQHARGELNNGSVGTGSPDRLAASPEGEGQ